MNILNLKITHLKEKSSEPIHHTTHFWAAKWFIFPGCTRVSMEVSKDRDRKLAYTAYTYLGDVSNLLI